MQVLFVHGRPVIRTATKRVLEAHGFSVALAASISEALVLLGRGAGGKGDSHIPWTSLVFEVGLPDGAGFELIPSARKLGTEAIIMVASVYRRTCYKRRPSRLYGADDYVEIHHLGDHLPERLRGRLGLAREEEPKLAMREAFETLQKKGDTRLTVEAPGALASLIVADLLLYNGDVVGEAETVEAAMSAIEIDLQAARRLFLQVQNVDAGTDPIGAALVDQLRQLEVVHQD